MKRLSILLLLSLSAMLLSILFEGQAAYGQGSLKKRPYRRPYKRPNTWRPTHLKTNKSFFSKNKQQRSRRKKESLLDFAQAGQTLSLQAMGGVGAESALLGLQAAWYLQDRLALTGSAWKEWGDPWNTSYNAFYLEAGTQWTIARLKSFSFSPGLGGYAVYDQYDIDESALNARNHFGATGYLEVSWHLRRFHCAIRAQQRIDLAGKSEAAHFRRYFLGAGLGLSIF